MENGQDFYVVLLVVLRGAISPAMLQNFDLAASPTSPCTRIHRAVGTHILALSCVSHFVHILFAYLQMERGSHEGVGNRAID